MHITYVYNFTYRCEMLPDNACQGVPLNFDSYAIDIANRPQLINLTKLIRQFNAQFLNISSSACRPFFSMSACVAEFPPCDREINRLLRICESGCSRYSSQFMDCASDIFTNIKEVNIIALIGSINVMFNCSDPSTYLPSVPGSLYETQRCHDLYNTGCELASKICVFLE